MDEINSIIGNNLKNLRLSKNLSLGQLSEISGISKALLGQIEKGNNNPTINTLWKIANGLRVPYTVLLEKPANEALIVTQKDALKNEHLTQDNKCSIFYYYPYNMNRNYEFSGMHLQANGSYKSMGHLESSQEYIFVYQGILTVILSGQTYTLYPGDSIHFHSDQLHEYRNDHLDEVHALIYNYYF